MAFETRDSTSRVPSSVTFDVILDGPSKSRQARCPERFQRKDLMKPQVDDEERALKLQQKQLKAQRNKEKQEAERLLRISQRREECRHMASKMDKLLAQDAKRQGAAGTVNIRPMSRREAGAMIQSVHRDFQRLGAELDQNLGT